jgi:hypothetical protein
MDQQLVPRSLRSAPHVVAAQPSRSAHGGRPCRPDKARASPQASLNPVTVENWVWPVLALDLVNPHALGACGRYRTCIKQLAADVRAELGSDPCSGPRKTRPPSSGTSSYRPASTPDERKCDRRKQATVCGDGSASEPTGSADLIAPCSIAIRTFKPIVTRWAAGTGVAGRFGVPHRFSASGREGCQGPGGPP